MKTYTKTWSTLLLYIGKRIETDQCFIINQCLLFAFTFYCEDKNTI